ncbi:MAG: hypothetical protein M1148_01125 [Candidatus Thermoplasmatota archaeon]|nr:hypothetical protein [Candidatus Thermoplasmatota archaeon]MCL5437785.1 hypothetical protein [Candidatus Thermoplasmatota archaeon]
MKIGLSASILRWLGILCFLAFFVYIGYIELIITSQIGKIPSNSDTQNLVNVAKYMYVFFIIFFIGMGLLFASSFVTRKGYNKAVGTTLTVYKLNNSYEGVARFEGLKVRVRCDDTVSVGDRIKATSFDVIGYDRGSRFVLKGKKLGPDDPGYSEPQFNQA